MLLGSEIWHYRELARFFITRKFSGFDIADEPTFDNQSTIPFTSLIRNCRFYLEYGSGGSTVMAARLGKSFISVDTDKLFLRSVNKKIGPRFPTQQLIHADIGLTGPWGKPLCRKHPSSRRLRKWRAYAETPWRFVSNGHLPDLVLVDGRFRVAATLTCFAHLRTSPAARILVDDYIDRPYYHIVEKHANLTDVFGRMAVFQPKAQDGGDLDETIDRYSIDWR